MKKAVGFVVGGVSLCFIARAISAVRFDIIQASTLYNAWEILKNGGYDDAAEYLNGCIENEVMREWLDRSIEEYNKSLCQK